MWFESVWLGVVHKLEFQDRRRVKYERRRNQNGLRYERTEKSLWHCHLESWGKIQSCFVCLGSSWTTSYRKRENPKGEWSNWSSVPVLSLQSMTQRWSESTGAVEVQLCQLPGYKPPREQCTIWTELLRKKWDMSVVVVNGLGGGGENQNNFKDLHECFVGSQLTASHGQYKVPFFFYCMEQRFYYFK